ncbi:DUF3805 domain-containing protein [uncultured Bacteroides sp.]|uniref:DUF3805 domain-containing protein n=1 Tax=uncultured Bacteroides sp. TaxID=162156 RepID=UPI002605B0E4|nr:DUF3805 domain-containing protein [uncultured Bacteroides sp.]
MESYKKFISPGAWFSMEYPAAWSESEDCEGSFLFYNPDEWTGNFRISAYRGEADYGRKSVRQELQANPAAVAVKVGSLSCAYSYEPLEQEGEHYTAHIWIVALDDLAFECSFTVHEGAPIADAEKVIASLQARKPGVKYPAELITVRLSEIYQINEAYEWMEKTVKELLKKDFQGQEEDVANMQEIIDRGVIGQKKRDLWLAVGIVLCVIAANEMDGLEWHTLIDGNREAPVLLNTATGRWTDPMKLAWSKVKAGGKVNLAEAYQENF